MIYRKSILEKLADTNPGCEIWWDASPLVFTDWMQRTIAETPSKRKPLADAMLNRLFGLNGLIKGVTTNPEKILGAAEAPQYGWKEFTRNKIETMPSASVNDISCILYNEIIRQGAEVFLPMWKATNGRYGYVSGQVNPHFTQDYDAMMSQAMDIASQGQNIMIKCPGSAEGLRLLEELTALGISTNATMSFSVSQHIGCMNAVSKGITKAKQNSVDLSSWRSVITHMSSRVGELGELQLQAKTKNLKLTAADIRWAEIAIFKRAYFHGRDISHPSKMLMCSMRIDKNLEKGRPSSWHIEKTAGSNAVFTCPPAYIAGLLEIEEQIPDFNPYAIEEKIPSETLDRLMKIPYFQMSYESDGMTLQEFVHYESFKRTAMEFRAAADGLTQFVEKQFAEIGRSITAHD